jgi:hypothetical protein
MALRDALVQVTERFLLLLPIASLLHSYAKNTLETSRKDANLHSK